MTNSMSDEPNRRHRVRVRYCETDRMGVAHHGAYIDWFEEARTEWLRERGASYRELEDAGYLLQVVHVDVRYRSSVTYDDELTIETRLDELRPVRVTLAYRVARAGNDRPVADGTTTLACVDRAGKPQRLPGHVVDALTNRRRD